MVADERIHLPSALFSGWPQQYRDQVFHRVSLAEQKALGGLDG
jgi:hypothetical protein